MIKFFEDIEIFSTRFFVVLGAFLMLVAGAYVVWSFLVPALKVGIVIFLLFSVFFVLNTIFRHVYLSNRFSGLSDLSSRCLHLVLFGI